MKHCKSPLRMAHGGEVPGKGKGDKIPAMYEPGEFVVSNAMLDAAPGLREELRALRSDVLAAQGKDEAAVDRNAIRSSAQGEQDGRQKTGAQDLRDDSRVGRMVEEDHPGQVGASAGLRADHHPGAQLVRQTLGAHQGDSRDQLTLRAQDGAEYRNPNVAKGILSSDALKWQASQAAPVAPPPTSPAPKPTLTPYETGKKVADFWRDPRTQGAFKLAGAATAISEGTSAVTDAQRGNYAGALDNGLLSASTVAGTVGALGSRLGTAGMAYGVGHKIGEYIYNNHLSDDTKDSIGGTINSGLRSVGNLFGQKWGVDDSAMQKLNGGGVPAPKPTAPTTPALRGDYGPSRADLPLGMVPAPAPTNTSQSPLSQITYDPKTKTYSNTPGSGENPIAGGRGGGTLTVLPAGATMGSSAEQALRQARSDAIASGNLEGALASYGGNRGGDPIADKINSLAGKKLTKAGMEALTNLYQAKSARDLGVMQNDTNLRGQDITREGHYLTNGVAQANARFQVWKDQRDHAANRSDKAFEQQQAADKNWNDHFSTIFQKEDRDGKQVVDGARLGAFTQGVDNAIGGLIDKYKGDPSKAQYVKALQDKGRAALQPDDRAALLRAHQLMEIYRGGYSAFNPLSSSGEGSNNLLDFMNIRPANTLQDRHELIDRNGKVFGSIPTSQLKHGPTASLILPNFGQPSSTFTR